LDITYCHKYCQVGQEISKKLLQSNDSVFDAVTDFQFFTEECFKTCPHKQAHLNSKNKES
jgi:hypothetical protein